MANIVVNITEYGKRHAEDITGSGLKYKVLSLLYQRGMMSASEIAEELGISSMKARMVVNSLIAEGKVKEE